MSGTRVPQRGAILLGTAGGLLAVFRMFFTIIAINGTSTGTIVLSG